MQVCTGDVTNAVTSEQVLSVEGSEMSILIKAFIEGSCVFCFNFNSLENSLRIMAEALLKITNQVKSKQLKYKDLICNR